MFLHQLPWGLWYINGVRFTNPLDLLSFVGRFLWYMVFRIVSSCRVRLPGNRKNLKILMTLFDRYNLNKQQADKHFHKMPNHYKKVVITIMEYFNLLPAYMFIKTKDMNITTPKHVFVKWLYEYNALSLDECAKVLGLHDHSTILRSIERANVIVKKYPDLWQSIKKEKLYPKQKKVA